LLAATTESETETRPQADICVFRAQTPENLSDGCKIAVLYRINDIGQVKQMWLFLSVYCIFSCIRYLNFYVIIYIFTFYFEVFLSPKHSFITALCISISLSISSIHWHAGAVMCGCHSFWETGTHYSV